MMSNGMDRWQRQQHRHRQRRMRRKTRLPAATSLLIIVYCAATIRLGLEDGGVLAVSSNSFDASSNPSEASQHASSSTNPLSLTVQSLSKNDNNNDDDDDDSNENDNIDDTGIIQLVETEIWDAVSNSWKGDVVSRWTNEQGQASMSPAEVQPPEGWTFRGDWKIVVSKSTNKVSTKGGESRIDSADGRGGVGDSMGWEYHFQYLRPPKRSRIWLRSLQGPQPTRHRAGPSADTLAVTIKSPIATTYHRSPSAYDTISKTMQLIRDDWNFKGLGFALYKSFIFANSFGLVFRLPLTVNFDVFDRHPEYPSVASSLEFYYPWTIAGFLSATVHVEWVKWIFKHVLGLVPRLLVYFMFKVVIPLMYKILSTLCLPFQRWWTLPACPATDIPQGFFWNHISQPNYNSELSERVGCSISYRWSKSRGFEFRFQHSYSYMPTFAVYRKAMSNIQHQWNRLKTTSMGSSSLSSSSSSPPKSLLVNSDTEDGLSSSSSSSSTTTTTATSTSQPADSTKRTKVDWWQKHFASLGISLSTPIPDPPRFSCSGVLSLSGLYFGRKKTTSTSTTTTVAKQSTTASSTLSSSSLSAVDSSHSGVGRTVDSLSTLASSLSASAVSSSSKASTKGTPQIKKVAVTTNGAKSGGGSTQTTAIADSTNHGENNDGDGQPRDPILSAKLLSRTAPPETLSNYYE